MSKIFSFSAFLAFLTLSCSGCDSVKSDEKIKEIADLESQRQVNAENEYLIKRAAEMEEDLLHRQQFYQAVYGTYEGSLHSEQSDFSDFMIRITLVPNLPLYIPNRTRTWDEIAADLENLYFNVQIVQWNTQDGRGAVGCRVERVRPDLIQGTISIASEGCPNFYEMSIAPAMEDSGPYKPADLASEILAGPLNSIERLTGKVQPSTNSNLFLFSATRVTSVEE